MLDIMEISEYNIYYRFQQYFMRESIYQKMSYN